MLKNISANWVLTVLRVLSAYVLMPFTLAQLGKEGYGLWILITSITGYLGLLTLGTPMASVRHMSQEIASKNTAGLNSVYTTFGVIYLLLGLLSMVVGAVLLYLFPMGFEVAAADISTGRMAMVLVLIFIATSFFQQLPYGLMASYHDFVPRNLIIGFGTVLKVVLTLAILAIFPNIYAVAGIQLVVLMIEFAVAWAVVKRRYPKIEFRFSLFDRARLKSIFSFSLFVMILNLSGQLSFQTDSIVIGALLTVGDIPVYTIANSLTVYFMEFVISVAAVVMPVAAHMQTQNDLEGLRNVFLKWSKICLSLSLLGASYLCVFGPRFLAWWIGPEFEGTAGTVLRILMFSFIWFLPVRGVAQPLLMGIGKPGLPTASFFVVSLLNLALSISLAPYYGLCGVAWGTAIPNILYAAILTVLCCKQLGLSLKEFSDYVLIRPILGSLPAFLLGYFILETFDSKSTFDLVFAGVSICVLFVFVSQLYIYRHDRFISFDLFSRLKRRLK